MLGQVTLIPSRTSPVKLSKPQSDQQAMPQPQSSSTDSSAASSSSSRSSHSSLIGRALVPFFLSDGAENNGSIPDSARDFSVGAAGSTHTVRQFVNGYFVPTGSLAGVDKQTIQTHNSTVAGHSTVTGSSKKPKKSKNEKSMKSQSNTNSNQANSPAANPPSNGKKSKGKSANPIQPTLPNNPKSSKSSFVAPSSSPGAHATSAAFRGPDEREVPMPSFLKLKSSPHASAAASTNNHHYPSSASASSASYEPPMPGQSILHLLNQTSQTDSESDSIHNQPIHIQHFSPAPSSSSSSSSSAIAHVNPHPHSHSHQPHLPAVINPSIDYSASADNSSPQLMFLHSTDQIHSHPMQSQPQPHSYPYNIPHQHNYQVHHPQPHQYDHFPYIPSMPHHQNPNYHPHSQFHPAAPYAIPHPHQHQQSLYSMPDFPGPQPNHSQPMPASNDQLSSSLKQMLNIR